MDVAPHLARRRRYKEIRMKESNQRQCTSGGALAQGIPRPPLPVGTSRRSEAKYAEVCLGWFQNMKKGKKYLINCWVLRVQAGFN